MRSLLGVLPFALLAVLSWGIYGPVMYNGQVAMLHGSLRPFICVGIAYFLVAVVVPFLYLKSRGEKGGWRLGGALWSLLAGALGALGALGIILAFKFGGRPIYVMPLVFGGAPVVNTFLTMIMSRSFRSAGSRFLVGVLLVATGAAGVLCFQPGQPEDHIMRLEVRELAIILSSIAGAALCWGAYGPLLHRGQMMMDGSRLRPFLCVGLAYFAIAVIVPVVLLFSWSEPGGWDMDGIFWSLAAGAAGALGALGIIFSFNFGGKPERVMPLVFGGSPVVNTFTGIATGNAPDEISAFFYGSLTLLILGAVVVLAFAPRGSQRTDDEKQPPVEPLDELPLAEKPTSETPFHDA